MSQSTKAAYYQSLKKAGVQFSRHYREYSTAELREAYDQLVEKAAENGVEIPTAPPVQADTPEEVTEAREQVSAFGDEMPEFKPYTPPLAPRDPNEMAGQRTNQLGDDEPLRVDEQGLIWYQEEVPKPAYAKPRGRRVLRYEDTGTKKETIVAGEYTETFEVAGDGPRLPSEIKITLPSYQVGIYKDPRLPFKIHVYNGNRGFDLFEVAAYYGGAELVPQEIRRVYIENVLCYDVRTTVRAIQTEYRHLQLTGKI